MKWRYFFFGGGGGGGGGLVAPEDRGGGPFRPLEDSVRCCLAVALIFFDMASFPGSLMLFLLEECLRSMSGSHAIPNLFCGSFGSCSRHAVSVGLYASPRYNALFAGQIYLFMTGNSLLLAADDRQAIFLAISGNI